MLKEPKHTPKVKIISPILQKKNSNLSILDSNQENPLVNQQYNQYNSPVVNVITVFLRVIHV